VVPSHFAAAVLIGTDLFDRHGIARPSALFKSRSVLTCREETRRHDEGRRDRTASLSAANLAGRARASDEATRRGHLPGLLSVVLRGSRATHRRLSGLRSPFCRGCGPCGTGQAIVLLETTVFVFAARTAGARLVAPWSSNRLRTHRTSVLPLSNSTTRDALRTDTNRYRGVIASFERMVARATPMCRPSFRTLRFLRFLGSDWRLFVDISYTRSYPVGGNACRRHEAL
jgi:hypothetical protein